MSQCSHSVATGKELGYGLHQKSGLDFLVDNLPEFGDVLG